MEVTGREILALHGNLGHPSDWDALQLPGLRAVDLWNWTELSFFEFAHELATTLAKGMDRPILAGYSLGGRLALYAMAIHPERWGGAIIASAHPGLPRIEDRLARRTSDAIWAKRARDLSWDEFLSLWDEQPVFGGDRGNGSRGELESKRSSIALAFETWSLGRQENLRSALRRFQAPVLWITGEYDEKFSALGDEMRDVLPGMTREVLTGFGHRVLGAPMGRLVRSWLSATDFSRRA